MARLLPARPAQGCAGRGLDVSAPSRQGWQDANAARGLANKTSKNTVGEHR